MKTNTGGPAFPIQGGWGLDSTGLTILDYFAAAALPALLKNHEFGPDRSNTSHRVAERCFRIADEMLNMRDIERRANIDRRRLLAAAPDLLAVVLKIKDWDVSNLSLDVPHEIRISMQSAIAKATGSAL